MARRFMAGPEYKKVLAGSIPAPVVYIPEKRGRIVQLQTARTVPATEAIA